MRKSYKTPEQLEDAMIELYGTLHGSQRKLAEAIGKHEVSVSRYMTSDSPVDETTAKLIDELLKAHRHGRKPRDKAAKGSIEDMM